LVLGWWPAAGPDLVVGGLPALVLFAMMELAAHRQLVESGAMAAHPCQGVVHVDEVGAVTTLDVAPDAPNSRAVRW
jgi:hypothetical protein